MRPATPWHLSVQPYADVRRILQTGDDVVFWGRGALSRAISRGTGGPSHSATVLVWSEMDVVFVLESVEGQGCRIVQLSRLIEDERTRYDGAVVILRHRTPSSLAATRMAVRIGTKDLGEGYAYRTLWLAAVRRVALFLSPRLERWLRDRYDVFRTTYICSEKAAEQHLLKGEALDAYASFVPEPADLWRDGHLEVIARVM